MSIIIISPLLIINKIFKYCNFSISTKVWMSCRNSSIKQSNSNLFSRICLFFYFL